MAAAFIYMVECCDGTLYTGWTIDLDRRVATHNAGRGSRYTRMRLPVKLVYWEECLSIYAARLRELELKRLRRESKLRLIAGLRRAEREERS